MARLGKRFFGNKQHWCIFWYDYSQGKLIIREVRCAAKFADNERQRNKMLRRYQEKEDAIKKEIQLHGHIIEKTVNDFYVETIIANYIEYRKKLVELRKTKGGKQGISELYFNLIVSYLTLFKNYCSINNLSFTSQISQQIILDFRNFIEVKPLSILTKNNILGIIKTLILYFRFSQPPVFNHPEILVHILKKFRCDDNFAFHFSIEKLQIILSEALKHDKTKCKITRESKMQKTEPDKAKFVPILPHILLFMLTGMRLSEGLSLRWEYVDLKSGIIRIKSNKTHKIRIIPLVNDMHANIAPIFLEILKIWKTKSNSAYVLPHDNSNKPYNIKKPLDAFKKTINMQDLTFQNLRKNFESYLISFGVPSSIDAIWLGHSPAVAEKHYISYVFTRLEGKTIEQAMNIDDILKNILRFYSNKIFNKKH